MKGKIGFENFHVRCIIGERPEERETPQDLLIDLFVEADIQACAATDLLKDTVDYVKLAAICREVAARRYQMLESYAYHTVHAISQQLDVQSVWIKVRKAHAFQPACQATVELMLNL